MTAAMEQSLLDAMNEALDDDSLNENPSVSGHSLQSVDVMDEAMNLLFSVDGEIDVDAMGDGTGEDDNEEEIDFDNFLKTPSERSSLAVALEKEKETEQGKKETEKATITPSPAKKSSRRSAGSGLISSLATALERARRQEGDISDESPTSATSGETDESKEGTPKSKNQSQATTVDGGSKKKPSPKQKGSREQPQVVPLKQFENALALIQDLENRIQVLETDRQCLLEEKEQLQETCNKQATLVADMEAKLENFPKLLEQTVEEESTLAASQAEIEIKNSFWRKDMARQEKEHKEEQKKKHRGGDKHVATTDSLVQSDFLKEVVEMKALGGAPKNKKPNGILMALRGLGNKFNNNSIKDNDNSAVDGTTISKEAASEDLKGFDDDEDGVNESSDAFEDNGKDTKALDLMT